jgi:hypothetical protein
MLTPAHMIVLGVLVLFGFAYDRVVVWYQRNGDDKFTALPVIVGVSVTLGVLALAMGGGCYDAATWTVYAFAAFAASGLGMTLGSLRRAG